MNAEHPSALTLDRFVIDERPESVGTHVAACAACAAFVAERRAWSTERLPPGLGARLPMARARRLAWPLVLLPAAACAALLLVLSAGGEDSDPVRAKAAPAIAVYIKREAKVLLWDGRSPLHAGDRVQLEVAPEGYGFVAIATRAGETLTWLHHRSVTTSAGGKSMLPFSMSVDADGDREWLAIVLSREARHETELAADVAARRRDAHVWVSILELDKVIP